MNAPEEVCAILRPLTKKQKATCEEIFATKGPEVLKIIRNKPGVKFQWSEKVLTVQDTRGERRYVEAKTEAEPKKITIDRKRFLDMSRAQRIALLTHEYFHFATVKGHPITDEEKIGEFETGRDLLNALGAAVAAVSEDRGEDAIDAVNDTSRAYRWLYFEYYSKLGSANSEATRGLLLNRDAASRLFNVTIKLKNIGLRLGSETGGRKANDVKGVTTQESYQIKSLAIGLQFQPVSAYLSRWSQLQVGIYGELFYGAIDYSATDRRVKFFDDSKLSGYGGLGILYLPVVFNFWAQIGYESRYLHYNFENLGEKIDEHQEGILIGGAYAI
jgi:hypothetical protein